MNLNKILENDEEKEIYLRNKKIELEKKVEKILSENNEIKIMGIFFYQEERKIFRIGIKLRKKDNILFQISKLSSNDKEVEFVFIKEDDYPCTNLKELEELKKIGYILKEFEI